MNKIYADTDVCSWHLGQANLQKTEEITAGSPAVFHMPYPYDSSFDDNIAYALTTCSIIVVLVSELHSDSIRFIVNHQHPKIKYFICGSIEGYPSYQWMDWFITTCNFYKSSDLLEKLNPYIAKPKTFDILLGWRKPHRQKIYDYITDNKLTQHVIMTYLQDRNLSLQKQLIDNWIWPNIDIPEDELKNTITHVSYSGQRVSLSQIISVDIYNQTAYSIVAETNWDNQYSFYTEKIVKPILAERLFIVFSGQYYLRNLRQLGFKTFDGIIDESYDSVEDSDQRFSLALAQMNYLIDQPQKEILDKIKPITEYNKSVMFGTDWYGDFSKELRAVLLDHTRQN
jgi:hypothetical protein